MFSSITKTGKKMENTEFKIGEKVSVKCAGSDVWAEGEVVGFTKKRIRCINSGTIDNAPRSYAFSNVIKVGAPIPKPIKKNKSIKKSKPQKKTIQSEKMVYCAVKGMVPAGTPIVTF